MKSILVSLFLLVSLQSCDLPINAGDINYDKQTLSEEYIISGLQEGLQLSARSVTTELGLEDSYFMNDLIRILLPEEVGQTFDAIDQFESEYGDFGLGVMRDSILLSLNRAAEYAAPNSINILTDAIVNMSWDDGKAILFGDSIAATTYLHTNTYTDLNNLFEPIIENALDVVEANRLWNSFARNYNSLLTDLDAVQSFEGGLTSYLDDGLNILLGADVDLPRDLPENLSAYTTGEALNGLFTMISSAETELRADPLAQLRNLDEYLDFGDEFETLSDDLIEEVFSYEEE